MNNLKEFRYAFVYKDEDLREGKINAKFTKEKEIVANIKTRKGLIIDLAAHNKNNDEYEIYMLLNLDKEELSSLSNKFVNISDKVYFIDFYKPNATKIPTIDISKVEDLYANPGNIWVLKENENTYFFKVSIPEENLFIWFYLDKDMITYE